jgi:hypothetical protein
VPEKTTANVLRLQGNNSKLEEKIEKIERIIESKNEKIVVLILQNFQPISQKVKFNQICSFFYSQPQTPSNNFEAVAKEYLKNNYLLQHIIRFNWI